ncbi:MAG: hypothetical protein Q7S26_02210 [bacterium]|nr:hypothetical protein [bacterium]
MNEQLDTIERTLAELQGKIDATYASSEKMRKYFLWMLIITVGAIIVPLFLLPFFVPAFLASQGALLPAGF